MALFDLIARLRLDGSAFQSGLAQSSKTAESFATKIGRSIAGAFGTSFMIQQARKLGEELIQDALTIQKLSDQFGISTDEVQRLRIAAAEVNMEFAEFVANGDRLIERLREVNDLDVSLLSKEDIDNLRELDTMMKAGRQVGKASGAGFVMRRVHAVWDGVTKGDWKQALTAFGTGVVPAVGDLADIAKRFGPKAPGSSESRLDTLKRFRDAEAARKDAAEARGKGLDLESPGRSTSGPGPYSDSLTAIGNFLGGSGQDRAAEQRHQQLIRKVEQLVENTRNLKNGGPF